MTKFTNCRYDREFEHLPVDCGSLSLQSGWPDHEDGTWREVWKAGDCGYHLYLAKGKDG